MTTGIAESLDSGAYATSQPFVINLCSSTSPMALAHPASAELKRYTFFVSRQRQDGRDRFRLHMGYFDSQEQADQLLEAVRDVYPAAWAGPAPIQGAPRRARITAVPAPVSLPQAIPAEVPATSPTSLEQTMSEMRDVLAELDDEALSTTPETALSQPEPRHHELPVMQSAESVMQPTPPAVQLALVVDPPRLQPVTQPRVAASNPDTRSGELTSAQALTLLEMSALPAMSDAIPDGQSKVRVLTPEDTQTLRDIKLDKANNAPPSFALQLVWSVTPIDATAMSHLAIFDAYTLYNVEGNRQGRKWYGLRLGFFTDPNSAAQVANYVRGDYRSVAVVPVSTKEIDRAGGGSPISPADSAINPSLKASEQLSTNSEVMTGFELVADDRLPPPRRDLNIPQQVPTVKVATRASVKASVKAGKTGKPTGKRVVDRRKSARTIKAAPGAAAVLESTLEILGASTLTIDDSKGLVIDEAAARRSPAAGKKPQNSKFSRLLSRLGSA